MDEFFKDEKPIVAYGLKRLWLNNKTHREGQHAIIFSCVIPGALIPMRKEDKYAGVYVVFHKDHASGTSSGAGYVLHEEWARRARNQSETVYRLARALQGINGLSWLYILRTGFVALGDEHLAKNAQAIMQKMREVLTDEFGEIDFAEENGQTLQIPSLNAIALAADIGVLLPNGMVG